MKETLLGSFFYSVELERKVVEEALWEEKFSVGSQLLKLRLEDTPIFLATSDGTPSLGLSPTTKLNREVAM